MATPTVQIDFRVPPGMLAVLDDLCAEAGQSRTRRIAQLVKNAQVRRDIERDDDWYRRNGPTRLATAVARQGARSLSVHVTGESTDVELG